MKNTKGRAAVKAAAQGAVSNGSMEFTGGLIFEGDVLQWIQKHEDGSIWITFNIDGDESYIILSPKCFESIMETGRRFLITGECTRHLPDDARGKGKIIPEGIFIDLVGKTVVFSSDDADDCDSRSLPNLIITSKNKRGSFVFALNRNQAKELIYRLQKMLEAQTAYEEATKTKTIQPSL